MLSYVPHQLQKCRPHHELVSGRAPSLHARSESQAPASNSAAAGPTANGTGGNGGMSPATIEQIKQAASPAHFGVTIQAPANVENADDGLPPLIFANFIGLP